MVYGGVRNAIVLLVFAACGGTAAPATTPPPQPTGAATPEPANEANPEATSLLGKPLYAPGLDAATRADYEAKLSDAQAAYDADESDADAIIWLGRRTAYLGRFRDAIDVFSRGIERHPDDARMYRHRGHRYITVRELDLAIDDLTRAAAMRSDAEDVVEPDGLPNAQNVPLSTLHTNIYYHLGLAYYLRDDLADAALAYRACLAESKNDDMVAATTYWLVLTLIRAGEDAEALALLESITNDMTIIENAEYYDLLRLFKGALSGADLLAKHSLDGVATPTVAYGLAVWNARQGNQAESARLLDELVAGDQWPSFGYIAAEADISRR